MAKSRIGRFVHRRFFRAALVIVALAALRLVFVAAEPVPVASQRAPIPGLQPQSGASHADAVD